MRRRKLLIIILLIVTLCVPYRYAFARSNAGGGEMAEFDLGQAFGGIAINLGSSVVRSFLSNTVSGAVGSLKGGTGFSLAEAFRSSVNWDQMLDNFNTALANKQVMRAISAVGGYYGWSPGTLFMLSNIISSAVSGYLVPESADAFGVRIAAIRSGQIPLESILEPYKLSNSLGSAAESAFYGAVRGAAVYAVDKDRIDDGEGTSTAGEIAGMLASSAVGNLAQGIKSGADDPFAFAADRFVKQLPFLAMKAGGIAIANNNFDDDEREWEALFTAAYEGIGEGILLSVPGINGDNAVISQELGRVSAGAGDGAVTLPSYRVPDQQGIPSYTLPQTNVNVGGATTTQQVSVPVVQVPAYNPNQR